MSKIAFIFPGQGAQTCGMGKDFYEQTETGRKVFDKATELLGFSVPELCFEPNDRLDITEYTQAAMVTTSIAMMKVLEENGVKPDVAAGLSLGEYCALAAARVMSEEDAITTVRQRGIFMQEEVPAGEGAMAAILALDAAVIEEVTADIDGVWIANYNCPGQIVITGEKAAVEACGKKCLEAGARRVIPLQVSGAFHSSLLQEAGKQLHQVLSAYELKTPRIPVLHNLTAGVADRPLIDLLSEQISHSVLLEDTIRNMLADGVDTFIEVGPGKAVSGFVKKCAKGMDVNILHVEDAASLAETLDYMKG